jgi:hypothetical protein
MILHILTLAGVFSIAILLMGVAVYFSGYRKDGSSCCGEGHCDLSGGASHDCNTKSVSEMTEDERRRLPKFKIIEYK